MSICYTGAMSAVTGIVKALVMLSGVWALLRGLNWMSYGLIKKRTLAERKWDLNICCGGTDGGGVNADIIKHRDLPRFVRIGDIYRLPFRNGQFEYVLCSHTAEHVEHPDAFCRELKRVGRKTVFLLPPLWDISAAFNVMEHRWLFLTLRSRHENLPPRIRLPLSSFLQRKARRRIRA